MRCLYFNKELYEIVQVIKKEEVDFILNENDYIKVNKIAYNKAASQYVERSKHWSEYNLTDNDWKEILEKELLNLEHENLVLEIGPGIGRILKLFESLHCRTIGVELSDKMLEIAKENAPNTIFIEGNILEVNFEDESFDAIFIGAVIHNFPKQDAKKLLKLISKWIKPNGKILLYTTIHEKSEEGFYKKEDYNGNIIRFRKKYTESEFKEMLASAGFEICYKKYNTELDRNKKWLTYIVKI